MSKGPLVSVFMPAYNQEDYIGEAIESVLGQTYENLQLVIGDDSSTDGTWEIIESYRRLHPTRIEAFRNTANLGITGNCNAVLARCRGDYVVFTAGDDLYTPDKISAQLSLMEADPQMVLCYHDIEVFDSESNRTLRHWNSGPRSKRPLTGTASFIARRLVERGTSFMAALSVMVRSSALPNTGYDSRIPVASEWLMWIEVLAAAPDGATVGFVERVMARYRMHSSNITSNPLRYADDLLVTLAIVENRYPALASSTDRGRAGLRAHIGAVQVKGGQARIGRKLLWRSLRSGWLSVDSIYWLLVGYIPFIHPWRERIRRE